MKIENLVENYPDEDLMSADGFEKALIGVSEDFNSPVRLIYSVSKCIDILVERDKMTYDEASEFFTHNVSGSYMGVGTPVWCWDMFE